MKIISLRHVKEPKKGIMVYAVVASRSVKGKTHIVTGQKRGDGMTWRCTCEDKAFNPRKKCDHAIRVEKAS
jgi:hypothetical protein